jgi:hypothetical protein
VASGRQDGERGERLEPVFVRWPIADGDAQRLIEAGTVKGG